jgi:hypothetical protein
MGTRHDTQPNKSKCPLVSKAWMTHPNTPFITERLVDGRIRSVARTQKFQETEAQEKERMLNLYGGRWIGIRHEAGERSRSRG